MKLVNVYSDKLINSNYPNSLWAILKGHTIENLFYSYTNIYIKIDMAILLTIH